VVIFFPAACGTQPYAPASRVIVRIGSVYGAGITTPPGPDITLRFARPAPPHGASPASGTLRPIPRPAVNLPVKTYVFGAALAADVTSASIAISGRIFEHTSSATPSATGLPALTA
jgi:hypothetical protein